MALTIQEILTPVSRDQVRSQIVATLMGLSVPADKWAPGGVASSILTAASQFLSMLSTQLSNGLQAFFLPTAVTLAIEQGDTGLLTLLATYGYGVKVPQATFASGLLTLTNAGGGIYVVAAGNLTAGSGPNTYQNTSAFTLPASAAITVPIQCTQPGSAGNATPGAVNTLVTSLLGVTCTNATSLIGLDPPSASTIQALCLASLGARSVRGPRSAYAYSILTAVNPTTGAPVNINRFSISPASHTGTVAIVVCSPDGTTLADDLTGVQTSVEGLVALPFGGARPDGVTVSIVAATPVPYAPTITPYVLAPAGVSGAVVKTAIDAAVAAYMQSGQSNPIGGATASDDQHLNTTFRGVFASGIYGAVAQGVASVPGCSLISAKGATDLALTAVQVATDSVVIATPVLTVASS